jgi:ADP-ribose pyrophosphatase
MSKLRDEPVDLPIVTTEVAFAGRVWNIRRETFELGDHGITREFMDHTGAVAVLALDDDDRVCLIRQYRHPVRAREWELPAGLLDLEGESPLVGAQRELAEEVDLVADRWNVLMDFQVSPGGSNEALRIYLARGIRDADEVFERTEEEAELEKTWLPLEEVAEAVLARDVQNSILVIGVLAALASKARGWDTLAPADEPWPRHPLSR